MRRRRWPALAVALALGSCSAPAWAREAPAPSGALDRAETLVRAGSFHRGAAILRDVISTDPENRRAKELLAFALESMGEIDGERRIRSSLAAEHPRDPRLLADLGRVLERSGEDRDALSAYRRARALGAPGPARELDAAIERTRGRIATEIAAPFLVLADPDASAWRGQAGAGLPIGTRAHVALIGARAEAKGRTRPGRTSSHTAALTLVRRDEAGISWCAGPRLHVAAPRGGASDAGLGAAIEGRARLGPWLEADWNAELATPWEESAVTILHGGRTTSAIGHLYAHAFSRRLLAQAGASRRRLTILPPDPAAATRPAARQSFWSAGVDVVLWRNPVSAVRGEFLDDRLAAPARTGSSLIVAYRHYDVATRTESGFASAVGMVPRGRVDEGSVAATLAAEGGGAELRAGLGHDAARGARLWRLGGALVWAPGAATRIALGYEVAAELAAGLAGRRRAGFLSVHADL